MEVGLTANRESAMTIVNSETHKLVNKQCEQIDTNANQIDTNASQIDTNASQIDTNASQIDTNASRTSTCDIELCDDSVDETNMDLIIKDIMAPTNGDICLPGTFFK
jgi:hypothetical protein